MNRTFLNSSDVQEKREERKAYAHSLFMHLCGEMGIEARLEFREYKRVIALALISKNLVRVNTRLLDDDERFALLGRDEPFHPFLERVLRHELLHLKLKTAYHPPGSFQRLV